MFWIEWILMLLTILMVNLWLFVDAGVKVVRIIWGGIFSGVCVACVASTCLGAAALSTALQRLLAGHAIMLPGGAVVSLRGGYHVDVIGGRGLLAADDEGSNIGVSHGSTILVHVFGVFRSVV